MQVLCHLMLSDRFNTCYTLAFLNLFCHPWLMGKTKPDANLTGVYAGLLSLVEIGLGSFLHACHIPFSGTFLSLNQSSFLTRITKLNQSAEGARTLGYRVSTVTALLKSLSPAGKKLFPMLAISAQGCLFSVGTIILGTTIYGCILGSALSSSWGILQPLVLNAFIFGTALGKEKLMATFNYFNLEISDFALLFGIAFIIKAIVAIILSFFCWRFQSNEQVLIHHTLIKLGARGFSKEKQNRNNPLPLWEASLRELLRPLFLLPFTLTALFLFFSESSYVGFVWALLRVLTTGYLFFLAVRLFPLDRLIKKWGLGGTALASAITFLEEQKHDD